MSWLAEHGERKELVYGVGINDADYNTVIGVNTAPNGKRTKIKCPFYMKWRSMLSRCYNEPTLARHPTYIGCVVCEEWHRFSNFRLWMETQDWQDKHLDKDLLVRGNKVYGPDTCCFISRDINSFLTDGAASRGKYPIGVTLGKSGKYSAMGRVEGYKHSKSLGSYLTAQEAHQAWLDNKLKQAYLLAAGQDDPRVARALIERYENYIHTGGMKINDEIEVKATLGIDSIDCFV